MFISSFKNGKLSPILLLKMTRSRIFIHTYMYVCKYVIKKHYTSHYHFGNFCKLFLQQMIIVI